MSRSEEEMSCRAVNDVDRIRLNACAATHRLLRNSMQTALQGPVSYSACLVSRLPLAIASTTSTTQR